MVTLAPLPSPAADGGHRPRLELRVELPPPARPGPPPARPGPPPPTPGAPGPGEAAIVVTLVNDAAQPVDVRALLDQLRPELVDGAGAVVPIPDQRIYAMPPRRTVPDPGPAIVEPGQRREVVRWVVAPAQGHTLLRVPHGTVRLSSGRYAITVRAPLRSGGTVEGWIADAARLYEEQGLAAAAARRRADEEGAHLRPAYARLAVAWQGDADPARYALTIP